MRLDNTLPALLLLLVLLPACKGAYSSDDFVELCTRDETYSEDRCTCMESVAKETLSDDQLQKVIDMMASASQGDDAAERVEQEHMGDLMMMMSFMRDAERQCR